MGGYVFCLKPHHPSTLQRVSLSDVFRWKVSAKEELLIRDQAGDDVQPLPTNVDVVDKGLSEYIQLLIAGIFSMCGEWWSWEVITILVGLLGPTQLAVDVIYSTMIPMYFMIPRGFGMAGSSRVGTLIG